MNGPDKPVTPQPAEAEGPPHTFFKIEKGVLSLQVSMLQIDEIRARGLLDKARSQLGQFYHGLDVERQRLAAHTAQGFMGKIRNKVFGR